MTVLIGLLVAFASTSFIFDSHNSYTQKVFFNDVELPQEVVRLKSWLFGIIGATIVGFHILMIMISENSFKRKEPWAYKAMWLGMLSWFFIDSGISLYFKAAHNVLLINLPALIMIGLPLVMTRKSFD